MRHSLTVMISHVTVAHLKAFWINYMLLFIWHKNIRQYKNQINKIFFQNKSESSFSPPPTPDPIHTQKIQMIIDSSNIYCHLVDRDTLSKHLNGVEWPFAFLAKHKQPVCECCMIEPKEAPSSFMKPFAQKVLSQSPERPLLMFSIITEP